MTVKNLFIYLGIFLLLTLTYAVAQHRSSHPRNSTMKINQTVSSGDNIDDDYYDDHYDYDISNAYKNQIEKTLILILLNFVLLKK